MPPQPLNAEQVAQVNEVVNRVLSSWVGYQLALKNNSAGTQTAELNQKLHEELSLLLIEHAKLEKYDVEDWLHDAFDEQFNLLLEDGSISEMSQILFECISLIRKQTPAEVPTVLNRLPNPTQAATQAQQTNVNLESGDESGSDEEME
ncbi:hypothetical protein M3Y97_00709200 [Aphelenchoides bicaudatus]|nr:hypothetical protein M3Y97_00709200 [Aphelenchoides bicaudatus]